MIPDYLMDLCVIGGSMAYELQKVIDDAKESDPDSEPFPVLARLIEDWDKARAQAIRAVNEPETPT